MRIPAARPAGPEWAINLPIYEVDLSRQTREGTFRAFEERLPALRELGVGILWLMPIHPRSGNPPSKPRSDSPYCVRDYYDVDPRYGTKDDFRRLVRRIHDLGMRVLLDWVGNHTSWGNDLIRTHPEFYARDDSGAVRQAGPWNDVAQLDYANREVWDWMLQARLYWITEFDVDGFREDVAGMIPTEHWTWLRPRLNKARPVFMLAEAQGPHLHPAFDASYDWDFQPVLWKILHFGEPAASIDRMLADDRRAYPRGALRMRHLTNHDMCSMGYAWPNRAQIDVRFLETTSLTAKYGDAHEACAVLCATLPFGKPMLWNGQELGILEGTPVPIPWKPGPHHEFYHKLLHLYRDSAAVHAGRFLRVRSDCDDAAYAFLRTQGEQRVLVAVNLSGEEHLVTLWSSAMPGRYQELFSGEQRKLSARERLHLEPWGYRILVAEGGSARGDGPNPKRRVTE